MSTQYKKTMSWLHTLSDKITAFCGDIRFVISHLIIWAIWIGTGVEPFPYGLLTLVVSLEAIVLSTFILMSQNRAEQQDRALAQHAVDLDEESVKILHTLLKLLKEHNEQLEK